MKVLLVHPSCLLYFGDLFAAGAPGLGTGLNGSFETIHGVVTLEGIGPPPLLLDSLDQHFPARDLVRQRPQ